MREIEVIDYLSKFRSYEFASLNCGIVPEGITLIVSERRRNPNTWDRSRYSRIVNIIKGAVDHVLSDDQRMVIMRRYLDRNRSNIGEIATAMHKDRTTIGRWHKEAIEQLSIAFEPLRFEDDEITLFEHMWQNAG